MSQADNCYKMWCTGKLGDTCLFSALEPFPRFGVSAWLCLLRKAVSWGPGVWSNPWVGLRARLLGNLELCVRSSELGPWMCALKDWHAYRGIFPIVCMDSTQTQGQMNACWLNVNVRVSLNPKQLFYGIPHILECSPGIMLSISLILLSS